MREGKSTRCRKRNTHLSTTDSAERNGWRLTVASCHPVATAVGEASGDSSISRPAGGLGPEEQSPHRPGNTESPERPGTSRGMEQLVRSAPAGRKATRKARNVDDRERGGFACSRSRGERSAAHRSREGAERVTESERDTERQGREEQMGRAEVAKTTMHCMDNERRSGSPSAHMHAGILPRQTGLTYPRTGFTPTGSSRPAPGSASTSALQRPPPIRSRAAATPPPPPPLPPPPPPPLLLLLQRSPKRTSLGADLRHRASSREPDPLWRLEVRLRSRRSGAGPAPRQSHARRTHLRSGGSPASGEEEEEDEEEGGRVTDERGERRDEAAAATADRMRSKREKSRVRSQRRRQRRREIRKQSRQQDSRTSSTSNSSGSSGEEEEDEEEEGKEEEGSRTDREGYYAVCLDVYFSPYTCHPCSHVFCEPCLRTLAKGTPANTPCPLCRTTITHVFFQKVLDISTYCVVELESPAVDSPQGEE
ncbi:hypothetical protein CRUP_038676 [Coryphaenoides rupestris]|nr:hypothetical protein CRUP_038676 [Coryphaenoides rupestris]